MDKNSRLDILPNREALRVYYDEYEFEEERSFEEFKELRSEADIYGLYLDGDLFGCIYFIRKPYGTSFHLAVKKEYRGKWMKHYKEIMAWMLSKYRGIHTAARVGDYFINSLLKRTGFEFIGTENNFNWYKL